MALTLTDSEKVDLSASGVDASGNPTSGTISWSVDDPNVVTLTDNGAGSATASAGIIGVANVTATDTDADGNAVTSTLEIDVVAGDTTNVTITPGLPEPK